MGIVLRVFFRSLNCIPTGRLLSKSNSRRTILTPSDCAVSAVFLMLGSAATAALAQDTQLDPVRTSITVIEKISAETPANITSVDQNELEQIPGVNL